MPTSVRPSQYAATPDARAEAELGADISGIIEGIRRIHRDAVDAYRPEVEAILRERSRDVGRIENTLDGLVAFCGDGAADGTRRPG